MVHFVWRVKLNLICLYKICIPNGNISHVCIWIWAWCISSYAMVDYICYKVTRFQYVKRNAPLWFKQIYMIRYGFLRVHHIIMWLHVRITFWKYVMYVIFNCLWHVWRVFLSWYSIIRAQCLSPEILLHVKMCKYLLSRC